MIADLTKLKAAAIRVHPQRMWFAVGQEVHDGSNRIARCPTTADADLIAACSPVAVLALLRLVDAYEALTAGVAGTTGGCMDGCSCAACRYLADIAAAKAAL